MLVTAGEAAFLGLAQEKLKALPHVVSCHMPFFLKDHGKLHDVSLPLPV